MDDLKRCWRETDEGCWEWIYGGGLTGLERIRYKDVHMTPRRAVWLEEVGEVPKNLSIRNNCGNDNCVNPAHQRVRKYKRTGMKNVDRSVLSEEEKQQLLFFLPSVQRKWRT